MLKATTLANKACSSRRVSIIIVNFNGKHFLRKLFSSLSEQTFKDYEIIFVDNCSTDGSMSFLLSLLEEEPFDKMCVRAVSSETNLGFCKGNNLALSFAQGEYVVLLNNDTCVSSQWLNELVNVMDNFPAVGACQSKIILTSVNKPHYGLLLDYYGQTYVLQDLKQVNCENDILFDQSFYPSGASVILRKEALNKFGFFDEKLFFGDYDLAWRLRICGFRLATALNSVCFHFKGFTTGHATRNLLNLVDKFYHTYNERIRVLIKHYSLSNIVRKVPIAFFFMFLDSLNNSLIYRKPLFQGLLKAIFWNLKNLKDTLKCRQVIQRNRVIVDSDLKKVIGRSSFFVDGVKTRINCVFQK